MMNFLHPTFLIGAALVAIPIVLHLLRRDIAPEVPFTAVRLLRKSPIERSKRRRLRDLLLLAARVTALLLLAAAFARPYLLGGAASGSLTIVAVDRSFSMGAPGRFASALDLARAAIDAAGSGPVAVLAFDERADVVAPPGPAADARAALADLRPGFGGTRYGPVLLKAAEVADGTQGRVVLVTDLQRAGWEDHARGVVPSGLEIRIADAGIPDGNLALTSVRAETDGLVASIRNTFPAERSGDVRAIRDGRVVASARFTATAGAFVDVTLPLRSPAGSLVIALDDDAGFEADNSRFVTLDPVPRPAALIVTSGADAASGFYLARAIEAAAGPDGPATNDGFEARIVSGAEAGGMAADALSRYRAVVVLSTRGLDRRAKAPLGAFVRGGGGLLIAASPDVDPSVLSMMFDWQPALPAAEQAMASAALSATDLRHPIFEPFGALGANLGHVRFDRSWRVGSGGWDVVARFTDGAPALLERTEGRGRVVLFASDLDRRWNDFPLHPSYVPFVIETLHHVSGARDESREYVVGNVPDGVRPAPGVYPFLNRTVAVNVDARESATARVSEDEFRAMVDAVARSSGGPADVRAQQAEARQSYWQYALGLMLAVLVLESVIGKA
jgi:hypothetical protein